jgi:predicted nuclease with TOPRIM domain
MNEQARKLSLGQLKEGDLQPSIQSRFLNQGMKPGTAESIEFLILIQAVAYADQDIAAKQQQLKTIEREKQQLEVRIQSMKTLLDDLKGKLDGMNEMSEMTSLRLQMTMDRRSKFIETLSNIMKKIGTTQETIIQNIK